MPKSVKCLTILEEKSHKSLGISLFLLQLFFHSLYCHLEEEADEVLVRSFRTNHAEGRNVFLAMSSSWSPNTVSPAAMSVVVYSPGIASGER